MKVRIIQLLCPARHCIGAVAYESETGAALPEKLTDFENGVNLAIQHRILNPWCGICKSRNMTFEDQPTIFSTMADAMPFLRELEKRQAATRAFFEEGRN